MRSVVENPTRICEGEPRERERWKEWKIIEKIKKESEHVGEKTRLAVSKALLPISLSFSPTVFILLSRRSAPATCIFFWRELGGAVLDAFPRVYPSSLLAHTAMLFCSCKLVHWPIFLLSRRTGSLGEYLVLKRSCERAYHIFTSRCMGEGRTDMDVEKRRRELEGGGIFRFVLACINFITNPRSLLLFHYCFSWRVRLSSAIFGCR